LPKVNAIGKARSFPRLVSDWSDEQVAVAFRESTAFSTGTNAKVTH
jgi:hypothetical protein